MTQDALENKRKYPLKPLILITLLVMLLAIWYLTSYLGQRQTGDVHWHAAAEACEPPSESCQVELDAGRSLTFEMLTANPRPVEVLPVQVVLEGFTEAELEALTLELDLQGRDMYMGYNRTQFEHQGEGLFTATPLLGICTDEVMVWRASVLVHPPRGQSYGSHFDFTVTQRNNR
ncbi:hypothetical protein SAMN05660443_1974 [Marinospirillum celere]|uniref:Uncharacterized protein n=1 Tax=Marinospirillum celere TaxID=1122252 RepID=A0A1I1HR74_9GAMM|nr:hypothetical protein [Marinospirillum celere]SFC26414.1 hypothetical protein SAMN05660443_1974 [Marinospirillum celere]